MIWRETIEQTAKQVENNASTLAACRNSVQGKTLMVDDEGYVCSRMHLAKNGCCDLNAVSTDALQQYSCESCNADTGCCAIYEYCVSCCLNPERVSVVRHLLPIRTAM